MDRPESLPFTADQDANRLLAKDGLALLIGMLLDQQFPMERAFFGPKLLSDRLGRPLEASDLASVEPEQLEKVFRGPPVIHRYPASMAKRTQELCRFLLDEYGGSADSLWETADSGQELLERLQALPGFGKAKSRIFVGLLGKRLGVRPEGWETAAADWPSIADVEKWDDIAVLREQKRALKGRS
ncbi:MAG: HhH-GPD-type base excision DNA repair protein [Acidimicrobiia bacterium]